MSKVQIMVVDRTHLLVAVPDGVFSHSAIEYFQKALAAWRDSDEGALVISDAEIVWPEGRVEVTLPDPPEHSNPVEYCTACGGRAGQCDD